VRAPIALLRIPTCDLLLSSIMAGEMVAWCENLPRYAPPPILALLNCSARAGRAANNAQRTPDVLYVMLPSTPSAGVALLVLEHQPPGKRETSTHLEPPARGVGSGVSNQPEPTV
jgi:hypothetical protein